MAFIRKRGDSHQLVETYREGGNVRQRVLANLGPAKTLPEAFKAACIRARELEKLCAAHDPHAVLRLVDPAVQVEWMKEELDRLRATIKKRDKEIREKNKELTELASRVDAARLRGLEEPEAMLEQVAKLRKANTELRARLRAVQHAPRLRMAGTMSKELQREIRRLLHPDDKPRDKQEHYTKLSQEFNEAFHK